MNGGEKEKEFRMNGCERGVNFRKEKKRVEKMRRGKEVKLSSNLITQINVAQREQLPKWTKKRESRRERDYYTV